MKKHRVVFLQIGECGFDIGEAQLQRGHEIFVSTEGFGGGAYFSFRQIDLAGVIQRFDNSFVIERIHIEIAAFLLQFALYVS